jgi:hypothetical protein
MAEYIVVTREGEDTVHRHPSNEQCNVDDASHYTEVDEETAQAMLSSGMAARCEHCRPLYGPQTLNTRGPDA